MKERASQIAKLTRNSELAMKKSGPKKTRDNFLLVAQAIENEAEIKTGRGRTAPGTDPGWAPAEPPRDRRDRGLASILIGSAICCSSPVRTKFLTYKNRRALENLN